jgi:ASC-1-like (ASCH) protein
VRVKSLHIFENFKDLYQSFPKTVLGYKQDEEADFSDMEEYYSVEDIKKYGVIGILIQVIDSDGFGKINFF